MKTLKIIPLFSLLIFFNCSGQEKQNKIAQNSTIPDENITVNKEYDENGNLVKYDSIYSYSYSSSGKLNDSLKMEFEKHFKNKNMFNDAFFNDFFGEKTNLQDFNPDDFFQKGLMEHDEQIKKIMQRMDSLHQLFFNERSQPIIPAEPDKPEPSTQKMNLKQI
ncbi:hypothetical protein GSB9_00248 [Flavobacteriaceae bacterium GSB9]|nr:hypothetical protein GSB9_00248 [Flavobacteriaceae bacterium GSB9]